MQTKHWSDSTEKMKWMRFDEYMESQLASKIWMKGKEEDCIYGVLDEGKIVSAWVEQDESGEEGFRSLES